jgi:hypothetical protein
MYSSLIIEARLRSARAAGLTYTRLPRDESISRAAAIELLRKDDAGKLLPENQLRRPLKKDELAFIASEQLLCKTDFEYWATRYAYLELDPGVTDDGKGGIGPPKLAESQRHYLALLAKREEECHRELKAHGFTTGIRAYFHKNPAGDGHCHRPRSLHPPYVVLGRDACVLCHARRPTKGGAVQT